MKKLPVKELFKGYDEIYIPSDINDNLLLDIALLPTDITESSILFITEKVGEANCFFDAGILENEPACIVVSKACTVINSTCPIITADSVRAALSYALSNSYEIDYGKVKIIGVTGTNGKTTTATLVYSILVDCGYKAGFIGTGKILPQAYAISDRYYSMTTPDPTLLYPTIAKMINGGCEYIVMEVSSHSIALGKIAPIRFKYGIFTNLGNDHLDFHRDKEAYYSTKLQLFNACEYALFNVDDVYSRRGFNEVKCRKKSFGIIHQGDAYATEISTSLEGSTFYYREKDLIFKARINLIGAFNIYNALAALKCVIDLGIKPCVAKRSIERIDEIDGRMQIIKDDITVVIDYAHTPDAFYNCLKTLKSNINARQKLIAVFGCGGDRDRSKRQIFGKYASEYADQIIITEDNSRSENTENIIRDILDGINSLSYKIIKDREEAILYAIGSASSGDVIAIIGQGHEKYKITKDGYLDFDEEKIVMNAFKRRRYAYESNA